MLLLKRSLLRCWNERREKFPWNETIFNIPISFSVIILLRIQTLEKILQFLKVEAMLSSRVPEPVSLHNTSHLENSRILQPQLFHEKRKKKHRWEVWSSATDRRRSRGPVNRCWQFVSWPLSHLAASFQLDLGSGGRGRSPSEFGSGALHDVFQRKRSSKAFDDFFKGKQSSAKSSPSPTLDNNLEIYSKVRIWQILQLKLLYVITDIGIIWSPMWFSMSSIWSPRSNWRHPEPLFRSTVVNWAIVINWILLLVWLCHGLKRLPMLNSILFKNNPVDYCFCINFIN